jgi:hypothetical protein
MEIRYQRAETSQLLSLIQDHEEKALPWVSSLGGAFSFLPLVFELLFENIKKLDTLLGCFLE